VLWDFALLRFGEDLWIDEWFVLVKDDGFPSSSVERRRKGGFDLFLVLFRSNEQNDQG